MGVLNSYQRLDRVIPGKPWGDGSAGNATISSDPNTRETVTGTAGQNTSTIGSAILSNGDVVFLIQMQGTGAGQHEIQRVQSGGGTTSITWTKNLQFTYGTGAQAIKFSMNDEATVNAHSPTGWNGSVGGIEVICGKKSITVNGAINGSGTGFRGGPKSTTNGVNAYQGESTLGYGGQSLSANGMGGGGGNECSGAGGGHVASGGSTSQNGKTAVGGGTGGSDDLTTMILGGAGGGSQWGGASQCGDGGNSGGIAILISKNIVLNAGVPVNGASSTGGTNRGGGGGAGGSVLLVCETASLGTNQITSAAGSGYPGSESTGGNGSVGRIAVHHSGTVTGTTSPTFTNITDSTLVEVGGGGMWFAAA